MDCPDFVEVYVRLPDSLFHEAGHGRRMFLIPDPLYHKDQLAVCGRSAAARHRASRFLSPIEGRATLSGPTFLTTHQRPTPSSRRTTNAGSGPPRTMTLLERCQDALPWPAVWPLIVEARLRSKGTIVVAWVPTLRHPDAGAAVPAGAVVRGRMKRHCVCFLSEPERWRSRRAARVRRDKQCAVRSLRLR